MSAAKTNFPVTEYIADDGSLGPAATARGADVAPRHADDRDTARRNGYNSSNSAGLAARRGLSDTDFGRVAKGLPKLPSDVLDR